MLVSPISSSKNLGIFSGFAQDWEVTVVGKIVYACNIPLVAKSWEVAQNWKVFWVCFTSTSHFPLVPMIELKHEPQMDTQREKTFMLSHPLRISNVIERKHLQCLAFHIFNIMHPQDWYTCHVPNLQQFFVGTTCVSTVPLAKLSVTMEKSTNLISSSNVIAPAYSTYTIWESNRPCVASNLHHGQKYKSLHFQDLGLAKATKLEKSSICPNGELGTGQKVYIDSISALVCLFILFVFFSEASLVVSFTNHRTSITMHQSWDFRIPHLSEFSLERSERQLKKPMVWKIISMIANKSGK